MYFYIGTIAISIIFQIITQIKENIYRASSLEKINYLDIGKYNVLNKKILGAKFLSVTTMHLIMLLIPGINLFTSGYALYKSQNKKIRNKKFINREVVFSIPRIIEMYKNQKSIEDSFRIDGLSEKEIKKEIKFANHELGYTYITDKMYDDIKASQKAIEYLKKINFHNSLNRKETIKLLKEYKKTLVCPSKQNINGKEKILKIANR